MRLGLRFVIFWLVILVWYRHYFWIHNLLVKQWHIFLYWILLISMDCLRICQYSVENVTCIYNSTALLTNVTIFPGCSNVSRFPGFKWKWSNKFGGHPNIIKCCKLIQLLSINDLCLFDVRNVESVICTKYFPSSREWHRSRIFLPLKNYFPHFRWPNRVKNSTWPYLAVILYLFLSPQLVA